MATLDFCDQHHHPSPQTYLCFKPAGIGSVTYNVSAYIWHTRVVSVEKTIRLTVVAVVTSENERFLCQRCPRSPQIPKRIWRNHWRILSIALTSLPWTLHPDIQFILKFFLLLFPKMGLQLPVTCYYVQRDYQSHLSSCHCDQRTQEDSLGRKIDLGSWFQRV